MAVESAEELRRTLSGLRLERGPATPRPPSRRWPVVVAGVVGLLVVLVLWRWLGGASPVVQVAQVTAVASGDGERTVPVMSGAGYVVSADRYISIGARVAGRIDHYLAQEGDRVQEGQALVQLDQREYKATLHRAEANLREARATAALRAKQLVRARTLAREGIISREDLDVRAAEAETADAAVGQAEAELQQAQVALEYTVLRAPRRGVILAKLKEVGEIAVPGGFAGSGDLIRMANLDDLRGQVDVTESELAKVRLGQRAEVVPDAYPDRRYRAHVVKLYPQVDRQKGTLRVEVQIEQPDDQLWPDMSARITFLEPIGEGGPAGVLVPRSAVRRDGTEEYAWRVTDGRVRRVPLGLGRELGEQVQVTAGLADGDTVVVGDAPGLRDGQAVTVPAGG